MPLLTDSTVLAQYHCALNLWDCTYYINWKYTARQFVEKELSGYTTRLIGKLMFEHVRDGGNIHQIVEKREAWLEWRFHYDLYVPIAGREIYFETLLVDDDPTDCTILVVSAHDP
jgi:hypothetical protein